MSRILILFLSLILFILLSACQSSVDIVLKSDEVTAVKLTCIQLCNEWEDKPFQERDFEGESTSAFIEAIDNVAEIEGVLDYGAEFEMTIYYNDKSSQGFDLSLGKERGNTGLLVALSNTHQGYSIDSEVADELRALIWE
jgi:hypothetical protein